MPGALVYTDEDLNIVICNGRLREMYRSASRVQPGRPYPELANSKVEHLPRVLFRWHRASLRRPWIATVQRNADIRMPRRCTGREVHARYPIFNLLIPEINR